jgi:toluene monooxygenase system protein A
MANLGALDEIRHTEIPLTVMHDLVKWDAQFDWVHRFYHTNNWVAIAARHMVDELLLGSNAIEFAIATNFVFETGFTNLQFVGLSALAQGAGDHMFADMSRSIQTDEARHAQIGPAVLEIVAAKDPAYAQALLDKWFWRSWHLFAIVTGFSMDYLTPLEARTSSFREFMDEWVIDQYLSSLKQFGLKRPWYWDIFLDELDSYHHMVYASAYSYRSTVWFNLPMPSPEERKWLASKYPKYWTHIDAVWLRLGERWQGCEPGVDLGVHGTAIIGFCDLCQIVLCGGTPLNNTARTLNYGGKKYIFCSEPCQRIFEKEPERYQSHKDLVKRVLAGDAPANLLAMLTKYFGLSFETWGKDSFQGIYPWLHRVQRDGERRPEESLS